jgi:hypothetical protein
MRTNFSNHSSIIRWTALAVLGLCVVQPITRAQPQPVIAQVTLTDTQPTPPGGNDSIWIDIGSPVGFVASQTLRFTAFNPDELEPPDAQPGPARAHVKVFDARGNLIIQSAEVLIPAGEFRSIDIHREDIPLTGEPVTGRLEVLAQLLIAKQQARRAHFLASLELVDNSSGKTLLVPAVQKAREVAAPSSVPTGLTSTTGNTAVQSSANDEPLIFFLGGIPLGFVRGQTMRISVVNPDHLQPQAPDGRKFKMLVAPLILNAHGDVIAAGDEITLDPGEFHSFDFDRDEIALQGEQGTGRLQVHSQIRFRFFSIVERTRITPDEVPASLELIDNSTGSTTVLISSKPKEIVVVGSH